MIVITGGMGFIGSVLLSKFNQNKIKHIIIVDEFDNTDKWKNLLKKKFIDLIDKYEFLEKLKNKKFIKNIKTIIHLGACSNTTETDMNFLYNTNTKYSQDLLYYCLENNIRFIYASSAAVYGNGKFGFSDSNELTPLLEPLNKYGFSKWLFDNFLVQNNYSDLVAGLRFFNVFGPNEYHKGNMRSVIYNAYFEAINLNKIFLFKSNDFNIKDGEQKRDFIYVKDVVDIIFYFYENYKLNGIYNIGTGNAETFNSLANFVFQSINKKINIEYIEMNENIKNQYQNFTQADITKLRQTGYKKEFFDFKNAIDDYIKGYLITNSYL